MPELLQRIIISRRDIKKMCVHAGSCLPEEACGILAGRGETVREAIPVTNSLHSPVRFQMEPEAQLKILLDLEGKGEEMIGYFHSHPAGPGEPSTTDIQMHYYPGTVMVILSRENKEWKAQAFVIDQKQAREIEIKTV